ncbi:hypothetical protein BJ912DRAFT_920135 [Pholiota molesta]|nr:hypothetical protein BJ912DRAFT_920135 [Pholiota molesta]
MANCYFDRQNNGFFTQLEEQLRAIEPTSTFALGTMSYGCEFHCAYFPPEKEGGFGRTQFYLGGNKDERGDELGLIFFGEISAKGNHSVGRIPKPITDETIVKDVLVLRPLMGVQTEGNFLDDAFLNQVSTLEEILIEDDRVASLHPKSLFTNLSIEAFTTSWFLPSDPLSEIKDNGLIKITMPPKYKVPNAKDSVKGEAPKKKNLLAPPIVADQGNISNNDTLSDAVADGSSGPAIALGALYDPNLLPDHRGRYFQHKAAKLVQLDMVDIDDNLIAPWDMADKLREGTVVLVEATLVCWHIAGKGNGDRDKKIYQIQGHRLRVLSESDEVVEVFDIPDLPMLAAGSSEASSSSPRKKASSEFIVYF